MSRLEITCESPSALDAEALASLWNTAYPESLATSPRAVSWATGEGEGRSVALICAVRVGWLAGFAVVGAVEGEAVGWIDALAIERGRRRPVVQAALVDACEGWLRAQGCTAVSIGGGLRSLLRGTRVEPQSSRFWVERGYREVAGGERVDLALDVARYTPPPAPEGVAGVVRPAAARDRDNVEAFLANPARLRLTSGSQHALRNSLAPLLAEGGRIADLMLLWTENGVQGLAQVVFRDSALPIEVAYPYTLPQPWSALGAVAVADSMPDAALHLLLDASIRRLHNNGVNSCVAIGATDRTRYHAFGFGLYRRWRALVKSLA